MSYKNKDWLYEQYWKKNRSTRSIASEFDVSFVTILYWMKKFGIERRESINPRKKVQLRCYCGILIEKGWYYCPRCGNKVQRVKMMRRNEEWEID